MGWLIHTNDDIVHVPWEWPRSGLPRRHRRPSFSRQETWIYTLLDPRDLRVRYVGRAQNANDRRYGHSYEQAAGPRQWVADLANLGLAPVFALLWLVMRGEDRAEWEWRWIDYFRRRGDQPLNVDPV